VQEGLRAGRVKGGPTQEGTSNAPRHLARLPFITDTWADCLLARLEVQQSS
jgi:hypothetical protein